MSNTQLRRVLDDARRALEDGKDVQAAAETIAHHLEAARDGADADQAADLLRAVSNALLPLPAAPGGAASAEPQQSDTVQRDALADALLTELLGDVAQTANLSPACSKLAAALVQYFAELSPREALVLVPAILQRQSE